MAKYPYANKVKARSKINNALRDGKIQKKKCAKCGASNAEAHHGSGYNSTHVTWLCRSCHAKERIGTHYNK